MKKSVIVAAMGLTVALNVILSRFLAISPAPFVRISVSFVAVALGSILCGPVLGGAGAAAGDLLGFILFPTGGYIPGITATAFLIGAVYGIFLYKKPPSVLRALAASAVVCLVLEGLLNSLWLYLALPGYAFWTIAGPRLAVNAVKLPVQTVLLYFIQRELGRLSAGPLLPGGLKSGGK